MTATRTVAVREQMHLALTGSHFRHSQVCAKTPEKAGLGEKEDCPQVLRKLHVFDLVIPCLFPLKGECQTPLLDTLRPSMLPVA